MIDFLGNFAYCRTLEDVDAAAMSFTVDDISSLPDPAILQNGSIQCRLTFDSTLTRPSSFEIVTLWGIDPDTKTLSVYRGQDGTTAAAHPAGTYLRAAVTAGMLERIRTGGTGWSLPVAPTTDPLIIGDRFLLLSGGPGAAVPYFWDGGQWLPFAPDSGGSTGGGSADGTLLAGIGVTSAYYSTGQLTGQPNVTALDADDNETLVPDSGDGQVLPGAGHYQLYVPASAISNPSNAFTDMTSYTASLGFDYAIVGVKPGYQGLAYTIDTIVGLSGLNAGDIVQCGGIQDQAVGVCMAGGSAYARVTTPSTLPGALLFILDLRILTEATAISVSYLSVQIKPFGRGTWEG